MKHTPILTLSILASTALSAHAVPLVLQIPTVSVYNFNNPSDSTGYGSVDHRYDIGKTEVTISQYTRFLNAVAGTDTYALYNTNMATHPAVAGIARTGSSGNYSYSVMGENSGNRPVTYVSWFDAARFSNWLHNGQPTGAQAAATTERGAYQLDGATSGVNFLRSPGAQWWIPSENEWYKSAYYDPTKGGSGYWKYATRSDIDPNSRNGSNTDANSANFVRNDGIANGYNGGYATTDLPNFDNAQNYLTDVGEFTLANSFYGTFDQSGSLWEWNDGVIGTSRVQRGGSWFNLAASMASATRTNNVPQAESWNVGFRVANAPEPAVSASLVLAAGLLLGRRKRGAVR